MAKEINKVSSAYDDEKENLEREFQDRFMLAYKIMELLDMYQYDLNADLVDGKPAISLTKRI